mgnify:CR=1 FL=1
MTYDELFGKMEELRGTYNAFAVAIDGMAGAGKTTLAAYLSKKYGAPVVHLDDFRLPPAERPKGWETIPGGDVDFERFEEEIVAPWMEKRPLVYTTVDPVTGEMLDRRALPDGQMFLFEGTYIMHPMIRDFFDLRLFVRVGAEEQARRLAAAKVRAGALPTGTRLDLERAYFDAYMTEALADGTLDGGIPLPEPNA